MVLACGHMERHPRVALRADRFSRACFPRDAAQALFIFTRVGSVFCVNLVTTGALHSPPHPLNVRIDAPYFPHYPALTADSPTPQIVCYRVCGQSIWVVGVLGSDRPLTTSWNSFWGLGYSHDSKAAPLTFRLFSSAVPTLYKAWNGRQLYRGSPQEGKVPAGRRRARQVPHASAL